MKKDSNSTEPVGYVNLHSVRGLGDEDTAAVSSKPTGYRKDPIYTHPLAAEAVPPASSAPGFDSRCPACLGSEFPGFKRGIRCATCNGSATVEPEAASNAAEPAASSAPTLPKWWPNFIQNICELPDRNSPEDEPDAMIATRAELERCALGAIESAAVPAGKFDHLSGRGMHELRFDELSDYVESLADNPAAQREAVSWIVSELERKTNDERVLAVKLDAVRTPAVPAGLSDAEDLVRRILNECDHAGVNDMRLTPSFGQRKGDIAVRESNIHAAIDGWRRGSSSAPPAK